MASEYYLLLKDPSGTVVAQIDDYYNFDCSQRVWEAGLLKVTMSGDSSKIPLFVDNAQGELWRRDTRAGIGWYKEFSGLFRSGKFNTDSSGINFFTASFPGDMWLLSSRIIAWPAGIANQTVFTATPVETIEKTIVQYNCGSSALVSNGRAQEDGVIIGLNVDDDSGGGSIQDWRCSWTDVLSELQKLAKIDGSDFNLVKTGPATWTFYFYPVTRGVDRTSTVRFALNLGNMKKPVYTLDKINESTVAIVGGKNFNANRQSTIVYGDTYSASNKIEMWVDARESDTLAYLQAKGAEKLYQAQARNKLAFEVIQTSATVYGREYFLGDLVTAYYAGITFAQRVFGVAISFAPSSGGNNPETIQIEMRDA